MIKDRVTLNYSLIVPHQGKGLGQGQGQGHDHGSGQEPMIEEEEDLFDLNNNIDDEDGMEADVGREGSEEVVLMVDEDSGLIELDDDGL